MALKPTAPGANGRRKSAIASGWVRAGGAGPVAVWAGMGWPPWEGLDGSGVELAPGDVEAGFGEKARRAAGHAPAAYVAAREHELVFGAGGGDVEQAPFLLEVLGVLAGERAPARQQLFLAAEQQHELSLGAFGAVDRGDGDAVVFAGADLLGVQAGGVLEEAGQRGAGAVLVGVPLGGAAE